MNLALHHWHIEISSKCTLKCPRCPRTESPNSLSNTELDLEFFKKTFTPNFIRENVEKITFCGDDGDPIYAHDLIEVIQYFKSIKSVEFVIVTNGSHKSESWWKKLGNTLSGNDQIHFSLDGWDQASNEQYRVNSDWKSIVTGVTTIRNTSQVNMVWDAIAFSFNEQNLDNMKDLAISLGFDSFQLTHSTKFGAVYPHYLKNGNDLLQPVKALMSFNHRFTRDITQLSKNVYCPPSQQTTKIKYFGVVNNKINNNVTPLCFVGNKGMYISSLGFLYPCCWVANRYDHNNVNPMAFDLNVASLESVLTDSYWDTKFLEFSSMECKTKCISTDIDHCTNW